MSASETPEKKTDTLERLLSSPDIQKAIAQLPDIWRLSIETQADLTKAQLQHQSKGSQAATGWVLLWSAGLALVVVIPVSLLSWNGKISADAATFLFGTLVGAAFTFLRNFFPSSA